MKYKGKTDLSSGSVEKNIMAIAIPMTLAEILHLLYNVVDRIFIGHIPTEGSLALPGIGICFPIISLVTAFSKLYGSNGGSPVFNIERGRGNDEEALYIQGSSFMLIVITGFLLSLIGLLFARPLLFLFGASEQTYPYAYAYFSIYLIGFVPSLITLGMNPFVNAQGYGFIGMGTTVIGAVCNLLLDPIFIFVFGWGIRGAAIATVISQVISCVWILSFLFLSAPYKLSRRYMRLTRERTTRICTLGLSGFIMGATNSLVQIVCNRAALFWGGDIYVGVMTVVNSIRDIIQVPMSGIQSGASPVMSYNYGAKRYSEVRKCNYFQLYTYIVYALVMSGLIVLFPSIFTRLFSSSRELIDAAVTPTRVYFCCFVFMAFQSCGQTAFVALGKARHAVFFSLLRKVIIVVPLTIALPFIFGSVGVVLAEPISNLLGGLAAYITMIRVTGKEFTLADAE
ncbi:MAG: MATE family efflux transporter [Spirochaetales bacterium]|nr:MATE family efflux transporter [Spirochaetales bacterium]